jgi:predicted ATP-grasp superfamily ATP-dependent carboligase
MLSESNFRQRAIILGVEHPRDAAAIRSLGKTGIPVDVVDNKNPPTAMWLASRYIRNKLLVDVDPSAAVEALEASGRREGGMLLPTNDEYLILVSKHFHRLSRYFTVVVPPWEILGQLMDKMKCNALARKAGVETPEHFQPRSLQELDDAIFRLDFDRHAYVLKIKLWDDGAADARSLRRVVQAGPDARSLRARCLDILSRTGSFPVIEEVVPGTADRCVAVSMVVDRTHRAVVGYCARRLKLQTYSKGQFKHPYELGANAYCESIHDHEAVELATRLVAYATFFGAITVEFKRDSVDGHLKLIKVDPRFVRATSLSTALGRDMPLALYKTFSSRADPVEWASSYQDGVGWIWLEAYLYSLWKNRHDRSVRRELMELIKRLPRIKACAYFDIRDPLPSLMLLLTAPKRLRILENRGAIQVTRPVSA